MREKLVYLTGVFLGYACTKLNNDNETIRWCRHARSVIGKDTLTGVDSSVFICYTVT